MKTIFFLILCCLASCTPKCEPIYGKVCKGRYYDPQGLFSIALPEQGVCKIEEPTAIESCSGVIFFEGTGQLCRIEALKLPDENFLSIALETTKEERNNLLRDLFHDRVLPLMVAKAELHAEITGEEIVALGEDEGYFAIISLSKESANVTEGFLSCFIGDQYVLFSERAEDLDQEQFLNNLLTLYQSYKNESIARH